MLDPTLFRPNKSTVPVGRLALRRGDCGASRWLCEDAGVKVPILGNPSPHATATPTKKQTIARMPNRKRRIPVPFVSAKYVELERSRSPNGQQRQASRDLDGWGPIYKSLHVQGRGALRRELTAYLRTGRALRVPRARARRGKSFGTDQVLISERPAKARDRAVPGHWEGDLILGLETSAIGTLVVRATRFTTLPHLPPRTDQGPRVKNGSLGWPWP
jgi:hypothetical protein